MKLQSDYTVGFKLPDFCIYLPVLLYTALGNIWVPRKVKHVHHLFSQLHNVQYCVLCSCISVLSANYFLCCAFNKLSANNDTYCFSETGWGWEICRAWLISQVKETTQLTKVIIGPNDLWCLSAFGQRVWQLHEGGMLK